MGAGRPRKTTNLKKIQGTLQPCRTNELEPQYREMQVIPEPPDFLTPVGREIYFHTCNQMKNTGTFFEISLPLIVAYANHLANHWHFEKMLNEAGPKGSITVIKGPDGILNVKVSGLHRVSQDRWAAAKACMVELGITPISMSKVSAIKVEPLVDLLDFKF